MEFLTQLFQYLHNKASTLINQFTGHDQLEFMTARRSMFLIETFVNEKLNLLGSHWANIFHSMKDKLPAVIGQLKSNTLKFVSLVSNILSSEQLQPIGECLLVILVLALVFKVIMLTLPIVANIPSTVIGIVFFVPKVIINAIKFVYVAITRAISMIMTIAVKVMKFVFAMMKKSISKVLTITAKVMRFLGMALFNGGKMMKAPGTKGAVVICRAAFEAAPKAYFKALRASAPKAAPEASSSRRVLLFGAIGLGVVCLAVKKFM